MKGSRSQLDRACLYLRRGIGSFKEREVLEKLDPLVRRKKKSDKIYDSDHSDENRRRDDRDKDKEEMRLRKSAIERELLGDSYRGPEKDRERDRERERDEGFHTVAVTVPCPASRAGCLIGSKGKIDALISFKSLDILTIKL